MTIQRKIASLSVNPIGLGCMNLSHAYGIPPDTKQAETLLLGALDAGVDFFDTAALYGFGANETLLGKTLGPYRQRFTLASKCGMQGVDGVRTIDGRPATIKATCEASLKRLNTDVIDLYYLHRWDKSVPIEDSVGAMSDLVQEGKIRHIGLSEVCADTLRRAHAIHPIAALQTEYSLWTRNPEIAVLQACLDIGAAFVAFSPLGRGFLTGTLRDVSTLQTQDIRRTMPRFAPQHYTANLQLLNPLQSLADKAGCTLAQIALAWLLAQGEHIILIPGTTQLDHLLENLRAAQIQPDTDILRRAGEIINQHTVTAPRYAPATQTEIDTEEF